MIWIRSVLAVLSLTASAVAEDRTYDGTGNNLTHTDWGAAETPFLRLVAADYEDGVGAPPATGRPSPRAVSNALCAQPKGRPNGYMLSDMAWLWGQFLDHDITLAEIAVPDDPLDIPVPAGDPWFDPQTNGNEVISFSRADYEGGMTSPREQINFTTSFIDGSMVYGPNAVRAAALRTGAGGKLNVSPGGLLPMNDAGLPNANPGGLPAHELFLAGDVRANEQAGLTAMHTLFVREHNRLCDELAVAHPRWNDDALYQRARKIVGALIQVVTYQEFLPALLGPHAPVSAGNYDAALNPSVGNEFATALYRVGHTMLPHLLMMVGDDNLHMPEGPMSLRTAFFNPALFTDGSVVDHLLKGFAARRQQAIDAQIIDDVRNFLFGPPGAGGFDLAALNIQRGRDHGLPSYNAARAAFSLPVATTFADISGDITVQQKLSTVYASVDDVDLWVGAIAEDHPAGSAAGALITQAMVDQFTRLRDGDRFWYGWDSAFTKAERDALRATTLRDIICRNANITRLQLNVFRVIPETWLDIGMNPTSGWRLISIATKPHATYQVQWAAAPGAEDADWHDFGSSMEGDGNTHTLIDVAPTVGTRIFRVLQFP